MFNRVTFQIERLFIFLFGSSLFECHYGCSNKLHSSTETPCSNIRIDADRACPQPELLHAYKRERQSSLDSENVRC